MNKKLLCGFVAITLSAGALAQSGTNSPYSQYGLGILSDRSQGFSRGMNGVGLALRQGNIANTLNPASYSAIDSLTMIFDLGVSGQITNFKEGGTKVNARNADFEYAVGSFRLLPRLGMAFGVLPYTNVGYSYEATTYRDATNGTITDAHQGDGGLHEVFIGAGWQVLKPLSVGVNIGYLWGEINRTVTSSSTSYINSMQREYSTSISNYKLEAGLQWQQQISRNDVLTLGATVGIGHNLNNEAKCVVSNVTNGTDSTFIVNDAFSLPMVYSAGLAWNHRNQLLVEADFSLRQWGSLDCPGVNAAGSYTMQSGLLKDSYKLAAGLDYVPNAYSRRNFLQRVHYRLGAGYATPYYNINGKEGPKELSISAGFGIPLQNNWNNRSVLNVSAQWVHTSATNMITENTFRLNLGITFNERWFAKWKID
ncbi:MAG: hypothetical protein IJ841_07000 [Prevotella sp.]|nr:hypothetical protein [Prevotella sp.]